MSLIPGQVCRWCGGALRRCYVQHQGDPPDPEGWHPIHARPRDHDADPIPTEDYPPPLWYDNVVGLENPGE